MSHFLTLVSTDRDNLYDYLERFCEQTEDRDYLEFYDETEEYKNDYERKKTFIRMPNGSIVEEYDYRFSSLYTLKDGQVYKSEFGKDKKYKRTKKAKKMKVLPEYSFKKIYKTFDDFAQKYRRLTYHQEEDAYGYYYNPDGQYDWCVVGGRWANQVLVKANVEDIVENDSIFRDIDKKPLAPKGYKWVSGAKKGDIEWELMKKIAIKENVRMYYKSKKIFNEANLPNNLYKIVDNKLLYWDSIAYIQGETLKEFCVRNGLYNSKYYIDCYAFVDANDEWNSKGDMGWFGISSNEKENIEWTKEVSGFIENLNNDDYVIFVDCHI